MAEGIFASPLHEGDYGAVRSPSTEPAPKKSAGDEDVQFDSPNRGIRSRAPKPESEAPQVLYDERDPGHGR